VATTAKTLTGARVKLYVNGTLAGIFNSCDYSVTYSAEPVYIMGKYNAAELVYTGMGTVNVTASGVRVPNNGPYEIGNVPQLQQLLTATDITLDLVDRQSGQNIMHVTGVLATGYNSDTANRNLHSLVVNFTGTTFSDESGPQQDAGATVFG
jgi:hypothetical protein